ncbi:hypothetical protein AX17_002935 [Amanita inopinata Kibby_2008]|nr:hypothetical protein AX17_002935 [Amanita inopinata Kibby_2008]
MKAGQSVSQQVQQQSGPPSQSQPQPPRQQLPMFNASPQPMPLAASTPSGSPSLSEHNRFIPSQATQRMMRRSAAYPDTNEVARATLLQMNEMSRRAEDIGFTYDETNPDTTTAPNVNGGSGMDGAVDGEGGASTASGSGSTANVRREQQQQPPRPPSTIWKAAANAGLFDGLGMGGNFTGGDGGAGPSGNGNGPLRPVSRQEALARIEEFQRSRAESRGSWIAAQALNSLSAGNSGAGGSGGGGGGVASGGTGRASGRTTGGVSDASDVGMQSQQAMPTQQDAIPHTAATTTATGPFNIWGPSTTTMTENEEAAASILAHEGLQVYTVGHLLPRGMNIDMANWSVDMSGSGGFFGIGSNGRQQQQQQQQQAELVYPFDGANGSNGDSVEGDEDEEDEVVRPSPGNLNSTTHAQQSTNATSTSNSRKLRVRRSTFVPGWAVPPRVLLVDDDAVSRKLSSKFLQVFGCTIDVAVDGLGAVHKMNFEKYDLVLMDVVMPKLDGVSATSMIRKFDIMTPIISMTSNSKPSEILTYYSSGMNDILSKPFTKQGLLDMLEKHLMHLKAIQQMSRIPRTLDFPGGSNSPFPQSLTSTSSQPDEIVSPSTSARYTFDIGAGAGAAAPDDDGRINPIAGLGLTDEQYNVIVHNIVNTEAFGPGFMTSSPSGGIVNGGSGGMMLDGGGMGTGVGMGMGVGGGPVMNFGLFGVGEKRALEDPMVDGREGKRSRFEVIE